MTELAIVLALIVLPLVAYALGRRLGKGEAERKLAGEKSALKAERESFRAEAEKNLAAVESGKHKNTGVAKALKSEQSEVAKRQRSLDEKERVLQKTGKDMREQNQFLRNYFLRRNRIDAYTGADALRKCGGVYVISRRDGLVKVGMTEGDFSRRFEEVRRDCERAGIRNIVPEILVPMDEGIAEVEAEVHEEFSEQRESGEWFRVSVKDAVNAVMSAAWRQHLRNTENRKYIEPPNSNEDDEVRGDQYIPHG